MGSGAAGRAALDWQYGLSYRTHGRPIDQRSLALAVGVTALLLALLASFGPGYRDQPTTLPVLVVFEVPDTNQPVLPPSQDVPRSEQRSATRDQAAPSPPPQPAMLAPMAAPVVPIPEIKLAPVPVPEVTLALSAQTVGDGSDMLTDGQGSAGIGGSGKGGGGPGGNGAGGRGTRPKLAARWAPEMRLDRLNAYFPDAALGSGHGGSAVVKCLALRDHRMRRCSLVSEYPAGLGFGAAALAAERVLRVQVTEPNGKPVYNTWVLFNAEFRHPVTGAWGPKE